MGKWLGDGTFWRAALRLALPIALQNLLMSSFAMVDTIMIGQLGETSLAAVGMAGQWSWLMNIFMFGVSSGSAIFISQYWGNREMDGISRTYGMVTLSAVGVALGFMVVALTAPRWVLGLFTNEAPVIEEGVQYLEIACISYIGIGFNQAFSTLLRSTENVKLPVYTSLAAVAANAFFNYALIFGAWGFPELGVRGAAIATAIAACLNPLLLYLISLAKRNILIVPLRRMFHFPRGFAKEFFLLSLPVLLNESIWAVGTMGYNMVFCRMGTGNYSAMTIFRTVEGIAFVFFVGLCHACSVMVGKSVGAGQLEQARADARRFAVLVPLVAFLVGLALIALRAPILSLFNLTAEVRDTAMLLLLIYGLEISLRNVPYVNIVGIFRAGGDTRTGMLYDIGCVWLISLPLTVVGGLVLKLPFPLVFLMMLLGEDIVKSALCIRRFRGGKWIKPVTDAGKRALAEQG